MFAAVLKDSLPEISVRSVASTSMKNGSLTSPAKTRMPSCSNGFPDDKARLAPVRCDDVPFLNRAPFRHITEADIDRVFCRAVHDAAARPCQRPQPKPVGDNIAEERLRCRHRKHIHDQDEIPRAFGAGKRVEVSDVHCWIAHHRRAAEMV